MTRARYFPCHVCPRRCHDSHSLGLGPRQCYTIFSIYIYIYIYTNYALQSYNTIQRSTEVPLRRSALSVCPCGDLWGTPLQLEISYSRAPTKPPQGRNTEVTSAKGRSCACPNYTEPHSTFSEHTRGARTQTMPPPGRPKDMTA